MSDTIKPTPQKICTGCNTTQPTTNFGIRRASPDGLAYRCETCVTDYRRKHYQDNRESRKAASRAYYRANRDRVLNRQKAARAEDPAKFIERGRAGYQRNKAKYAASSAAYYVQNRESILAYIKAWRQTKPYEKCAVEECQKSTRSLGWCGTHYGRWQRHGDPLILKSRGGQRPRSKHAGYAAAHYRVNKDNGPASHQACSSGCGRFAFEWCYDHCDSRERVDETGRLYSLDSSFYRPMCRACHRKFDAAARFNRATDAALKALKDAGVIDVITEDVRALVYREMDSAGDLYRISSPTSSPIDRQLP